MIEALARAVSAGERDAVEVVEEALGRHAPARLAYRGRDLARTRAMIRAEGALAGVTVSIKDLLGVTGWPTFAGTPRRLPPRFEVDGPVVRALREAGAVFTGKTHTVEFAFGGLGTNPHTDTPRNPHDLARVPGGSSAGAGVSLHGDALLAVGTDTAGSVRIPASFTGVVGLRTSRGRWPLQGVVPLSPELDTVGLLAHDVSDVAYAFDVVEAGLGHPPRPRQPLPLSGLHLGVLSTAAWDDCDPGVAEAADTALVALAKAGVRLSYLPIPAAHDAVALLGRGYTAAAELSAFLDAELPAWRDTLDPTVAARIADPPDPAPARRELERLRQVAHEAVAGLDALLLPTVAITPPRRDALVEPEAYRQANLAALRNTAIISFFGMCGLSLPCGVDAAGMPVGLQLAAPHLGDARLLDVALAVEGVLVASA